MPRQAKFFLSTVILCGATLAGLSLAHLHPGNNAQFAVLLTLALLGSLLKLRLPGMEVTMSISFLPVAISLVALTHPEAVTIAGLSAAAQVLLRTHKPPRPVQVMFNIANITISASVAGGVTHGLLGPWLPQAAALAAAASATIYYLVNAVLLCAALSLMRAKPFGAVWDRTYWLSLPYYAIGTALIFLAADVGERLDWRPALLPLCLILLGYQYYRQAFSTSQKGNS
jgi:hypothetical protein